MRCLLIIMLVAAPVTGRASEGRVLEVSGSVERVGSDGTAVLVKRGDHVSEGELIHVGDDAQARLLVDDQAVVELGARASLRMQAGQSQTSTSLRLLTGRLWAQVATVFGGHSFEVVTDNAVAGVRGTSFIAEVDASTTTVMVENGAVEVRSHSGQSASLGALERLYVAPDRFERSIVDAATFSNLRERPGLHDGREGHLDLERRERLRTVMRRAVDRGRVSGLEASHFQETLREDLRNRRTSPLDIDPALARGYLDRLRALRLLRRLAR